MQNAKLQFKGQKYCHPDRTIASGRISHHRATRIAFPARPTQWHEILRLHFVSLRMTRNGGFTLIELLILIGIFSFLIGLATINFSKAQQASSLSAAVNLLTTDLRAQQFKAMTGDTSGSGTVDNYGVYFNTESYTLFRGNYVAGNPENLEIDLPGNTQIIASTFPSTQAIFIKGSGENSTSASNTITVQSPNDGIQKTITVNRLGVVE